MHEKLKEAIQKDELIIFVGAGVSIPFGFPNWTNLIIDILNELKKEGSTGVDLDHFISQGKGLDVFQVLNDLERKGLKSKVKQLLYNKIKEITIEGKDYSKIEKFWKISDKIITTNYDKVLEEKKPRNIDVFNNYNEFQQAKSLEGNSFLYKIHGDFINPKNCILFESDYKKLYKKTSSDLNTFKAFISTKTILFIGFSFEDKYIKKQFKYLNQLYKGYGKEHFIVLTENKDLRKFNLKPIKVKNWDDSFNVLLDELIALKKDLKEDVKRKIKKDENTNIDISIINDINYLKELLEEKKKEFDTAEEKDKNEVSKKMHRISHRIRELLLREIDLTSASITHEQTELEFIFEEIFASEKISKSTLSKINEIRDLHSKKYEWYHRSTIVSALACSLINHKKVDSKKIDLLIDFTADTEDKVWEKAITYLFITLNHLGNKWVRFNNLKPKLESLKSQERIQHALQGIIGLIQLNLHQNYFNMEMIFENEYFKKSPFNYFLPFYPKNPSVDKIYEDDSIDGIEEYVDYLYKNPFPDSLKYLICNTDKKHKKRKKEDITENELSFFDNLIHTHVVFNPYINYVNEFISFYKYFPDIEKRVNEKADIITFKNLKSSLLSSIEHHRAVARSFMLDKNYSNAITHLNSLLSIEKNDKKALRNLADCYIKVKNLDDELKVRLNILNLDEQDDYNHARVGEIYRNKKDYKLSLDYLDKAISLDKEKGSYYEVRGETNYELNKNKKALKDCKRAIDLGIDSRSVYVSLGNITNELNKYKKAIKYYTIVLEKSEKDKEKSEVLLARGNVYRINKNFDESYEDIKKAINIENSYVSNLVMSHLKYDLEKYGEAIKYCNIALEKVKKESEKSEVLRFRGNFYRINENFDESYADIKKAISIENSYANNLVMGDLKDDMKEYDEAIKYYNIALEKAKKESEKSEVLRFRGGTYRRNKNFDESYADIKKAMSIENSFSNNLAFGLLKDDMEEYDEAINYYNIALEKAKKESEKSEVLRFRGNVYRINENFDESYEDIKKAINIENSFSNNLVMGHLKDDMKEYDEAIKYYNMALEKAKRESEKLKGLSNKANVLRKQKKMKKALKILKEIIKDFEGNSKTTIKKGLNDAYETIALVYSDMGEEENFYSFLEKALKNKAKAKWFYDDLKEKYKEEERFKKLLKKYNQELLNQKYIS